MTAATPESRANTPNPRGRFRFSLRAMLIFVGVMALLAFATAPLYRLNQRLRAEYTTAQVIRDTTDFVELHNGQWPASWDDLPTGDHARQLVQMRFDVKIYPHAERQLNELRDVLIRHNVKAAPQALRNPKPSENAAISISR